MLWLVLFFFSSRRRHTRYWRDWSSDVCSSDLAAMSDNCRRIAVEEYAMEVTARQYVRLYESLLAERRRAFSKIVPSPGRSEERRVGKECRSRWSPYH